MVPMSQRAVDGLTRSNDAGALNTFHVECASFAFACSSTWERTKLGRSYNGVTNATLGTGIVESVEMTPTGPH